MGREFRLGIQLSLRPPISKVSKPIPARVKIRVLEIFPSGIPPNIVGMTCTSREDAMYATTRSSTVIPRTAVLVSFGGVVVGGPDRARVEPIAVLDVVVRGLFGWRQALDSLAAEFADDFGEVGNLVFDVVWDRAAVTRGSRASDPEQVREAGSCETEISVWKSEVAFWLPCRLQINAVGDERERRSKVDVCTSSADDNVDFPLDSVVGYDSLFCEALDRRLDEIDILLG